MPSTRTITRRPCTTRCWVDGPGRQEFLLHQSAGRQRAAQPWHTCPCCVGNIPRTLLMLPTWTYARSAGRHLRQPVRRQHHHGGERRRHRRRDGAGHGLSLERQGVHHRQSQGRQELQRCSPRAEPRPSAGCTRARRRSNGLVSLSVNGRRVKPAMDKGLRRDHAGLGRRATRSSWSCR